MRNNTVKEECVILYVKTIHLVTTHEEAAAFNADRYYACGIYARDMAIVYGELPVNCRFENLVLLYEGTRNARYENELAAFKRAEIGRGFSD